MNSNLTLGSLLLIACMTLSVCSTVSQDIDSLDDTTIDKAYLRVKDHDFYDVVSENKNDGYFVFFGAVWCDHCRDFKQIFSEMAMKSEMNQFLINPTFILYELINDPTVEFFKVNEFPTLIYIKDGKYCKYRDEIIEDKIVEFFDNDMEGQDCYVFLMRYPGMFDLYVYKAIDLYSQVNSLVSIYNTEYPTLFRQLIIALITTWVLCIASFCMWLRIPRRPQNQIKKPFKSERPSEMPLTLLRNQPHLTEEDVINVKSRK